MRTLTALLVLTCTLYQADGMSVQDNMQRSSRKTRDANAPAPIECKMSPWSQWTSCDPCTRIKYRSRGIEVFGQFQGSRCIEPIGDREPCVPSTKCDEDPPPVCKSSQWQCESQNCINKNLKCNGDDDCGDGSDEDDCNVVKEPCRQPTVESDIALHAGYGINILGSGPRMNPFNNKVYKGQCNRVREPTSSEMIRLPWNLGVLNYETKVEETTSKEMYEDVHSLIKELNSETTISVDLGLSLKYTPTESSSKSGESNGEATGNATAGSGMASAAGSGLNLRGSGGIDFGYSRTNMIKQISEYTETKRKVFMRVKGRVQLATYRMKQRGLEVDQLYLNDVDALPLEYEKGPYFAFLEDYGTHYTKNGRSGGEYELVYILNYDEVKNKESMETQLKNCFEVNIKGTLGTSNMEGDLGVKPKYCTDLKPKDTDDKSKKGIVEKVLISVKGGSAVTAIAMKTQLTKDNVLDINRYIAWAETLSQLPALIHSDPEPIYNSIPLDFLDGQSKRDNLRKALDDYVAEYSVCKCNPCQNGGTVIQIDGECKCLCPLGTEGVACQVIDKELAKGKEFQQRGNWGCWSAWTGCSVGRRSRTRTCNTQGVTNAICKGDTASEDYC
ncbi:complement component C9 [Triplophysa dalaica]|uniref:complement component C9 n=1 Tax=Triplophysa dalaica TaxID=1582913 RepID=UPI0024DF6004|nr:complement component C9 [Triplophysa dalaica]